MISKKNFYKLITIIILIVILLTWFMNNYILYGIFDPMLQKFRTTASIIQKYGIETSQNKNFDTNIIKGMIGSLEDKENIYLTSDMKKDYDDNSEYEFLGIGIKVSKIINGFMVLSISDGSSCKEKIKAGDIILKVNSTNLDDVKQLNTKMIGDNIELEILRDNVVNVVTIKNTKINDIEEFLFFKKINNKNIAIIDLKHINTNIVNNIKKCIKFLNEKQDYEKIIIDLRNNRDFNLKNARNITEEIVTNKNNEGKLIPYIFLQNKEEYSKQKESPKESNNIENFSTKIYGKNEKFPFNKPVDILVNKNSYSTAEIIASSLRNINNVKIIGESTFGRGYIDEVIPVVFDSSAIKIATHIWYTSKGEKLNIASSITPDIQNIDDLPFKIKNISSNREYLKKDSDDTFYKNTIINTKKVLNYFNYKITNLDNYFDDELYSRIIDFQKDNNLEETGKIDRNLLIQINKKLLVENLDFNKDTTLLKATEN